MHMWEVATIRLMCVNASRIPTPLNMEKLGEKMTVENILGNGKKRKEKL